MNSFPWNDISLNYTQEHTILQVLVSSHTGNAIIETLRPQLSDDRKIEINHTNEAILFCAEHTLIKYLGLAEKLIKENFPVVRKISFSVEYDPEISDQWVIADIEVFGEIDQVIAWEDEFVKEWVATVPYPERNMIRLSCDII